MQHAKNIQASFFGAKTSSKYKYKCRVSSRLKSIFYKNIHENPSHTKNLQGLPLLRKINGAAHANFLYEMDFQVCSYKKWTLIANNFKPSTRDFTVKF